MVKLGKFSSESPNWWEERTSKLFYSFIMRFYKSFLFNVIFIK